MNHCYFANHYTLLNSSYLTSAFVSFVLLLFSSCGSPSASDTLVTTTAEKPNILFIFTDDHTYDAIGALGDGSVKTPNIDKLVNRGTTFTQAYNMGGWQPAICMASRAMIVSGRSLWNVSNYRESWKTGDETALDQTWPRLLRQAGYETYFSGKWHVDAPADVVFDHALHVRPGMPRDHWNFHEMVRLFKEEVNTGQRSAESIMPAGYNRPHPGLADNWMPNDSTHGGFWQDGRHWSEVLADDGIKFLQKAKDKAAPFMMYLAFNAPHDPRQAPTRFQAMYPPKDIKIPENFLARYPHESAIGSGAHLRDEALAPFPRTAYAVRTHLSEYYAIISHLDEQVGKIIEALNTTGKANNTYIIFTADHGLAVGKHGFIGKQNMYEHSVKVPFIICGPGIEAGKKIDAPIYLQDIMATSLDWAGIERPDYLEFNSLQALLNGKQSASSYPAIYGAYMDTQRMLRKGDHKLIVYPKAGIRKLFNLADDPAEMNDLSVLPEQQALLEDMMMSLRERGKFYRDTLIF